MSARVLRDAYGKHDWTVPEVITVVTAVITTVLTALAFVFKFPVCAGILAIITSVVLGIFLAVYNQMLKLVRLLLILFVLLLLAVGLWLIISSLTSQKPVDSPKVVTNPGEVKTWDFEKEVEGWGEHPDGELHTTGRGVVVYRDRLPPIWNTGDSSLQFTPQKIKGGNAYVTVLRDAQGSVIEAFMYVRNDPNLSLPQAGSTARIIVWDKNWISHESDHVELQPGIWQAISWDVRGELWASPWREFGIHFYFVTDYKGAIYIDTVTLRNGKKG